jgi:hypothetical protein
VSIVVMNSDQVRLWKAVIVGFVVLASLGFVVSASLGQTATGTTEAPAENTSEDRTIRGGIAGTINATDATVTVNSSGANGTADHAVAAGGA